MKLTESQRRAVAHDGRNLQLIACAGSGKTEVVAQRVVHLLDPKRGNLAPANIIAFTFTDKAAGELKERIVTRVHEALGDVTVPEGDERPAVVDVHPAADPVLFWSGKRNRREVPVLPLQRNEIVSESRIAQIIERVRKAADNEVGATAGAWVKEGM